MIFKNDSIEQGLRIIIIGCGKVGRTLTEQLSKEGHDITIIDRSMERVSELSNQYDVMGMVGNGASYSLLQEAGIDTADLIIAVTESDELNLLCCTIAKQAGNCAAIARVRDPEYSGEVAYLRDRLGLAMIINPELEAAKEMARILYLPTALEVNSFAHGQAEMINFKIPEGNKLDGITIADLGKSLFSDILICAIQRENRVIIPSGSTKLSHGDIVSFVSERRHAKEFLNNVGFNTKQVKNAIIVGGGKATFYLASQLLRNGIDVKIIEQNHKRCEELSIELPKAIIINGDGTDEDLLKEAGLATAEAFIPLTGIDEENIMLTLYAKQNSNAKVITKINRIGFSGVVNSLDLGSVVYPRFIASEAIIAYVRAKTASIGSEIETLYHMFDSHVEAIEFTVEKESALTNVPLMELPLKDNLLICFIGRKEQIIIPSGQDTLQVGDSVMVVTTHTGFNELSDILK